MPFEPDRVIVLGGPVEYDLTPDQISRKLALHAARDVLSGVLVDHHGADVHALIDLAAYIHAGARGLPLPAGTPVTTYQPTITSDPSAPRTPGDQIKAAGL